MTAQFKSLPTQQHPYAKIAGIGDGAHDTALDLPTAATLAIGCDLNVAFADLWTQPIKAEPRAMDITLSNPAGKPVNCLNGGAA